MEQHEGKYTVAGTNIEEVKKQNDESGLSYNEVFALLAKTGGEGTAIYSDPKNEVTKNKLNH